MIHTFSRFNEAAEHGSELLYHGTKKKFTKFELGHKTDNPTYGGKNSDSGLGVFFTDNPTMAKFFAGMTEYDGDKDKYVKTGSGHVVSARVHLNNPFIISDSTKGVEVDNDYDAWQLMMDQMEKSGSVKKYRDMLIKAGHDGLVLKGCTTNYYQDGSYSIVVVFDPKNIEIVKWD